MADVQIKINKSGRSNGAGGKGEHDDHGERGERGERGHRGHRDHHGANGGTGTGGTGAIGATGSTGATGPAGAGSDIFQAAFRAPSNPHFPGMPVFIAFSLETGGITTVQQTDVRATEPRFSSFANVHGLIVAVNGDGTVQVQSSGLVTLSMAQWNAATGSSVGLVLGHTYYPAIFPALGLTDVVPTSPGAFRVPVGVALNATTMRLAPETPVQILGDSIYFAVNTGSPPPVGTPVYADDTSLRVTPAINNGTVPHATPVGVIAAYEGTTPIIQTAGIVTLTVAEWAVVTGGLVIGDQYYVSGSAGRMMATRPAPPRVISLVGEALSATQLLLSTPSVPVTG